MTDRIPLWVDLRHVPRNKRLGHLGAARAARAEAILLATGDEHLGKEGLDTVAVDAAGTLRRGRVRLGRVVDVQDAASQRSAAKGKGLVVVHAPDWRVIPLENLIAARRDRPGTLFALAGSPQQALLFAQTLETGVHGIVLAPRSPGDIADADRLLRDAFRQAAATTRRGIKESTEESIPRSSAVSAAQAGASSLPVPASAAPLALVEAKVLQVTDAGMGDRVCVDCTARFVDGEGLLVGSTARSFALVHAETVPSDLVPTRPFRVNAGAVHSYLLGPAGRTVYLSELAAGSRVLAVGAAGSREMTVGRAKVEPRPHVLVEWEGGSAVLQNAETVRLVTPRGPVSVTALKPGDLILVHPEAAARHTGLPVDGRMEER
ncbi:MAG: 3-dehydroquinate synthase [Thermoplasmata archaeon]|jgi:3-dehydroquinate synthase II|nr:3-dehydroquinate synthase [Thermoplasmata archaeon]